MSILFYLPGAFRKVADFLFYEFNFYIPLKSINCVFRAVRSSFNQDNCSFSSVKTINETLIIIFRII